MRGELLEAEVVRSIIGSFFEVYNYFGYGLSERIYCGALAHELRDRGHSVVRELMIQVRYKGQDVAKQRLDMVIDDKIIVENKATEKLCPVDQCSCSATCARPSSKWDCFSISALPRALNATSTTQKENMP